MVDKMNCCLPYLFIVLMALSVFIATLAIEFELMDLIDSFNWEVIFPIDYVPPKRKDTHTLRLLQRSRFAYNEFDLLMIG